jgi:hypothetical protein
MFYHQLNALYLKTYIRFPQKVLKTPTYVSASLKPSSGGVIQLHLFKNHVHAFVQYYTPYSSPLSLSLFTLSLFHDIKIYNIKYKIIKSIKWVLKL